MIKLKRHHDTHISELAAVIIPTQIVSAEHNETVQPAARPHNVMGGAAGQ